MSEDPRIARRSALQRIAQAAIVAAIPDVVGFQMAAAEPLTVEVLSDNERELVSLFRSAEDVRPQMAEFILNIVRACEATTQEWQRAGAQSSSDPAALERLVHAEIVESLQGSEVRRRNPKLVDGPREETLLASYRTLTPTHRGQLERAAVALMLSRDRGVEEITRLDFSFRPTTTAEHSYIASECINEAVERINSGWHLELL